ncbi:unannotated protein [freshwater metagenome]|uniref:Unannotated protein n=1 Tax=freshwater metagenome TaxID=449393 RepID=A0A6J7IN29_9ZZZZ|nr:histidinol-phosphate transaminase [Actinomycetota bacterium]
MSTQSPAHSERTDSGDFVRRLLRPHLAGEEPYGAPQLPAAVRLNTNENSFELPELVVAAIGDALTEHAAGLNRYPDREFAALRHDLANYLSRVTNVPLSPAQIWAGNGSNEILTHIVQAFGGPRGALGFTPTYAMYPKYCLVNGTPWLDGFRGLTSDTGGPYDLDPDDAARQVRSHDPAIVFIASPNNPSGTAVSLDVVEAVYDAAPDAIIVVDEAYGEFAREGTTSAVTLLEGRPRLVVSRTMSKAFSLAGGRVGYLAADPEVIAGLRLVRLPYHLSTQTQLVARAALRHADAMLVEVDTLRAQRDRIVNEVNAMGLRAVPSDANFVLFGGLADEQAVWQGLLDHGVLVRDVGLSGHLRVTAGTPQETSAFLDALRRVTSNARTVPTRQQPATDYDELAQWAENDMTLPTNSHTALRGDVAAAAGRALLEPVTGRPRLDPTDNSQDGPSPKRQV